MYKCDNKKHCYKFKLKAAYKCHEQIVTIYLVIYHITHRCHKKEFLLKLVKGRQRFLHWLFQAKKRYDLSILNYIVTSNHIDLLVDAGEPHETISKSIQLIAGRTGQEYKQRKNRKSLELG